MKITKELYKYISQEIINGNHFNTSRNLGKLSELITLCNPKSKEEWEKYYFDYIKETGLIKTINKNLNYIQNTYPQIKIEDVKYVLRRRVIEDMWNGWERELSFEKYFNNISNKKIEHSTYKMDSEFGVDYLIYNNNEIVGAIQVKPISYILNNNQYIQKDKIRNKMKYNNFYNQYGIEVLEVAMENNEVVYNLEKLKELV